MNRLIRFVAIVVPALVAFACSAGDAKTKDQPASALVASVAPVAAAEQPIARFIRATGTLMAEEQAEVAAVTPGRVVAAPIERGTSVAQGAELVRISSTETEAQVKEAEANAAQIEARLGLARAAVAQGADGDRGFDANAVPEVQNAKAGFDLAQAEFNRIQSLLSQRVVSQSEFDQ